MSRLESQQYAITPAASMDPEDEACQKYICYGCLAERIRIHMRHHYSSEERNCTHDAMTKVFQEDPSKYPSNCPAQGDKQGAAEYWTKCMELTPEDTPDFKTLTVEQCTMQYIVSAFAMQVVDILELDHLKESRHTRLISKCHDEMVKQALEYERELGLPSVELSSAPPSSPQFSGVDSLHEWVFRRIKVVEAGVEKQYLVADAVTSYRKGTIFVLEDLTTNEVREIPEEDFDEIVASAEPLSDDDEDSLED